MKAIDADTFLRLIRGQTRGPAASLARLGLGLCSAVYGVGAAARNTAYDRGWKRSQRAAVPVVSVGNITLGGTGKTPMVEWIARWYRRRDVRVTLISRGYGHAGGINDEGLVLEENLPDVPHLQDPDRVKLAAIATVELEAELIILDDGFQHRRLARDLDLVMLDALDPFGLGKLFPRGLLREPVRSLRRASAVDPFPCRPARAVPARADPPQGRSARPRLCRFIESRHAPIDLIDGEGQSYPLDELAGKDVAAFCGIGNPEGFRRTLVPLCRRLPRPEGLSRPPPLYGAGDVRSLTDWAGEMGANLALTTQKDLVKLRTATLGPVPLRACASGWRSWTVSRPSNAFSNPPRRFVDDRSAVKGVTGKHVSSMKIAVFCPNLIGDTVMATPTFRALRGQFPDARFTAIIRPNVAPVLDGTAWFDETILFHHRSDRREQRTHAVANLLRQMRNDVAILLPNSFRAAWVAWMAGIPRRIGYVRYGRGILLTDGLQPPRDPTGKLLPTPIVEYYLALARVLGCRGELGPARAGNHPRATNRRPIGPGTSWAWRRMSGWFA